MKTWTVDFTTKVEKEQGEQPCKLVHINYGSSSHLYLTDADQAISLGGNTYYPYIRHIDAISFDMPEEDTISSVANVDIEIMRNATTDVLLSNYTKNRTVEIYQYFIGLVDADKLALATMIVENIDEATQETFVLKLKAKEVLLKEIPVNKFNETDFPNIVTDNLNLGIPIVFGKLESSDPVSNRLGTYRRRAVPCFCTDKYERQFLLHKLGSYGIGGEATNKIATKFMPQWNVYTFLVADSSNNKCYDFYDSGGVARVDLHTDFTTYQGNRRRLKLMPTMEGNGNTTTDWKDCVDFSNNTSARLLTGGILKLTFPAMGGFIANADVVSISITFDIVTLAGSSPLLHIFYGVEGGSEWSAGADETTTGIKTKTPSNWNFDNNTLEDCYIKFTPGLTTDYVDIRDVYIDVVFVDREVVAEGYVINRPHSLVETAEGKAERESRTGISTPPKKNAIATSKIFCDVYGIDETINPGSYSYLYYHPIYIIYAILNYLCGYTASEITATGDHSFDEAYDWLGTTYTECGNQIQDIRNALDYIRDILFEYTLKLYIGADGKFKLFKLNKAETSKTVFRDLDMHDSNTSPAEVYQMRNFKFYQSSTFYNKFTFNYFYDFGNGSYGLQLIEDRNSDGDLSTWYGNYNNVERSLEVNCNWRYNPTGIASLFTLLKKYWKQTKTIVEFDTNLVGTKLELGDTIQTNHKAQTWDSDAKDFQVIGLEQDGETIHIKAIEIIT